MRIGELAAALNCTVETIRFYEKQGLLPKVQRTGSNIRQYNESHLERLSFICYCRSLGISLAEIKQLIELEQATTQQQEIQQLLDRHLKEIAKKMHELDHLRMQFIQLKQKFSHLDKDQNMMKNLFQHSQFIRVGQK